MLLAAAATAASYVRKRIFSLLNVFIYSELWMCSRALLKESLPLSATRALSLSLSCLCAFLN